MFGQILQLQSEMINMRSSRVDDRLEGVRKEEHRTDDNII